MLGDGVLSDGVLSEGVSLYTSGYLTVLNYDTATSGVVDYH